MGLDNWTDLLPSKQEVEERRQRDEEGLLASRRSLLLENIQAQLLDIEPSTETEKTLVNILKALLYEEVIA